MTPAVLALQRAGIEHALHPYDHDPRAASYGLEAAEALGVDADRVFKTLVVDLDGALAVAVVPVSGHLDVKALARVLGGSRAAMADVAAAERATGYVAGGISPIGQKRQLATAMDETAELWDTVFVSAGRRGLDVELDPTDLIRITAAALGDLSRS